MSRARVSIALASLLVAAVAGPSDAKDASLYRFAVFPDGHWIGHGTITVTHAGSAGSSTADGSFNFDLTIKKGVASGTMVEDYSGHMSHGPVTATFDGISSGSGWTLTGNGGKVIINGSMSFTGQATGNGHTFPINMTVPASGGTFAPDEYTCSVASGNMATPAMPMFATSNTTISAPWTAVNVGGNQKIHGSDAEQWFKTMDEVDADVAKIQAGNHSFDAAQVRALIAKAQIVLAHIASAERCYPGGSHITAAGESFLARFENNLNLLTADLKAGEFK